MEISETFDRAMPKETGKTSFVEKPFENSHFAVAAKSDDTKRFSDRIWPCPLTPAERFPMFDCWKSNVKHRNVPFAKPVKSIDFVDTYNCVENSIFEWRNTEYRNRFVISTIPLIVLQSDFKIIVDSFKFVVGLICSVETIK
jgi:hypothetical protein